LTYGGSGGHVLEVSRQGTNSDSDLLPRP